MRWIHFSVLIVLSSFLQDLLRADPVQLVSSPAVSGAGDTVYFSWRGDLWRSSIEGGRIERVTSHSAHETNPKLSNDGQILFFASNMTGVNQVYRMDANGGKPLQLTFHSEGSIPVGVSRDDERVFTTGQRDAWWRWSTRFFSISSTQPRTGENELFNAYGSAGSVSPDGQQVLFSREGMSWSRKQYTGSRAGQIWLWRKGEDEFRKLLGDGSFDVRYPLWAPDGSSFFYVSEEDGTRNLWQYTFKTERRRQLTKFTDDGVISPAISADGSTIVFRRLFDLYRYDPRKNRAPEKIGLEYHGDLYVDDNVDRRLQKATSVSFSKSGKTIAFVAGGDVWVMDDSLREPIQVTNTAFYESEVVFDEARDRLLFISGTEGQVDIYEARRRDGKQPWWRNRDFTISPITNDSIVESNLQLSPKGTYLTYAKHRDGIWMMRLDGEQITTTRVIQTWSSVAYDWAPDEGWLTYSAADDNFNYDVHITEVANPDNTFNVSKHPDNEFNPVWSPDGKTIAFVGRRFDHEYDIYYVSLKRETNERTSRDEKLEQALKSEADSAGVIASTQNDEPNTRLTKNDPSPKQIAIEDLSSISQRIRQVSIPSATETQLVWSPDSKVLAFQAEIDGKQGLYTITPYFSETPKFVASAKADIVEWRQSNNRIYWLKDGVPAWMSGTGNGSGSYPFSVSQLISRSQYHREIFDESWRIMREDFYDENFNNKNWDEIRRKYLETAANTVTRSGLSRVIAMMLGELNASHLGYRGPSDPAPTIHNRNVTGHLGIIAHEQYNGPGIKVRDIIPGSPASLRKSELLAGDLIQSINGITIDPAMDITLALNGTVGKETVLKVTRANEDILVSIYPITYSAVRSLLYNRWIDNNQTLVEKKSNGQFGYLHIKAMDMTSFHRFERELFEVADGKDGIVIDVRENGGGFTTDHLLTILTQPRHAITRPRGGGQGYPQDRSIYATWDKPIVVLCNQNSHSNAEIFSHAIRYLERGKVVGVPTSGSVISTGSRSVMDAGSIRIPFRGWYLLSDGQDMELNGAVPHFVLWPIPGQLPEGIDIQLNKAISVLKRDVAKANKETRPTPIKASERGLHDDD